MRATTQKRFFDSASLRWAAIPLSVLALVAGVMAATAGTNAGSSKVRAGPSSVVFTVVVTVLVLAAVAMLVALVLVASNIRPAQGGESPTEPKRRRLTVAGVVTAVVVFVVFLLSRLRRHHLVLRSRGAPGTVAAPHMTSSSIHFVPAASYATAAVVVALFLAFVLVPLLSQARRRHGRLHDLLGEVRTPVGEAGGVVAGPVSAAVAAVRVSDPSEEPDPRRAVVAAYLRMADAAEQAGAPRAAGETAEEFLQRLLSSLGVPGGPAVALTSVFERARYSYEPIGEEDRAAALTALEEIRSHLGSVAASLPAPT